MPKVKGATKTEQAKYERCVQNVKKKNKGKSKKVNPHAVCMNSVFKGKKKASKKKSNIEFDYDVADDIDLPNGYEFDMELKTN